MSPGLSWIFFFWNTETPGAPSPFSSTCWGAQVGQIVLVVAARAVLPDMVEPWILPLLEGPAVEAFIESAFQKAFGPEAAALPPVTDALPLPMPNDDAWNRPSTDADFAPSQAEKYGRPDGQHRRSVAIVNTSD